MTVESPVFVFRPLHVQLTLGATLLDAQRKSFQNLFPMGVSFPWL